ncbi:hypothetical protein SEUCBS139899_005771 [Sporothrix eucalyptigena]|uniref:Dimethylaniline monooxygenase n=1 Tax=Sporothrix eucalyptigena TaxID=1812306 RepID=A0ABP0BNC8_9PEZI
MSESYDCVVVGAGWYGLAAAKPYIQANPDHKIAMLEAAESCGGTWSQNRLYPGLKSNNMVGTYEHPDFPLREDIYGVKPNNHIPGAVLHRYLTDFARHFGIYERIQFHTKVDVIRKNSDDSWTLTVVSPEGVRQLTTARLILATGLTSTPNFPQYPGHADFGAPFFHAKNFCSRAEEVVGAKNVVVVGGAKSAYDVAYAMVEQGTTVDLVVRPEGNGPVWISPPFVTPLKKRLDQLLLVRALTWFSPCPWGAEDGFGGIRRFLHGTALGRFFTKAFWNLLMGDVLTANDYDSHPDLAKLKPWHHAFWTGSGLSILNYNTPLWDMVRAGKIHVHVDDVDRMAPGKVMLKSGQVLAADACICSTGWKKESSFRFEGLDANGLGLARTDDSKAVLNAEYDNKVLDLYPALRDQPVLNYTKPAGDPLRMYRFIVPPTFFEKRTLAFAGMVSTVATSTCAATQGLWITAYLGGKLARRAASEQEITHEVMLHTQWGKWRFPCGYGASLPDFVFESIPYVDLLLRDCGIHPRRKTGLLANLTSPHLPSDYRGVADEWMASNVKAATK